MATRLYAHPSIMHFGSGHPMGGCWKPPCFAAFCYDVLTFFKNCLVKTSTGSGMACLQIVDKYPFNGSAIALASPIDATMRRAFSGFPRTDDEQSSGSLTYSIYSL
jgi:hypothetical protein